MTSREREILQASEKLPLPYNLLVESYALNGNLGTDAKRAEKTMDVLIMLDQCKALKELTEVISNDTKASEKQSQSVNRLTRVLIGVTAIQALVALATFMGCK